MTTETIQLGWVCETFDLAIKQGSSGSFTTTSVVVDENDEPLDSYDGWTAKVAFDSTANGREVISLSLTVVGDAGATSLKVAVDFTPDLTADLHPGIYRGDVWLTEPSPGTRRFCPAQFTLKIQPSAVHTP